MGKSRGEGRKEGGKIREGKREGEREHMEWVKGSERMWWGGHRERMSADLIKS